jgi:hypothetical protein
MFLSFFTELKTYLKNAAASPNPTAIQNTKEDPFAAPSKPTSAIIEIIRLVL